MVIRSIVIWLCALLGMGNAAAAELSASVDRNQLRPNEPVLFTLSLNNSDTRLRAEGVDANVDLTRLSADFDIGRPEASSNYNIYLGQGRATSEIKVELFPKRSGRLTIPAFEIDGVKSAALTIDVLAHAADAAEEVFARSGSNIKTVWAGQQLVVYIDLYHRVELASASMGSTLETAPMMIDLLPYWELPQASRKERHKGFEYEVERIAWALFPQQAGAFKTILPDVWVTTQAGRKVRLPHQTLEFDIKALPAGLPAGIIIGKPQLTARPLPQTFKQYELSQWTLTLEAPVPVTTLPQLLPGVQLPDGLKLYPDPARYQTQKTNDGIRDVADYTLSIMPLTSGEFELPPIRVPYFDPATGKAELVELPGANIDVAAGTAPPPEAAIATDKTSEAANDDASKTASIWPWQTSTFALALLWLSTLYLWRRQQNQAEKPAPAKTTTATKIEDQRHPLQQQLLAAMNSSTLEAGLQQWLQRQPDERVVLDAVRAVQRFCYGHGEAPEAEVAAKVRAAVALIQRTPEMVTSNKTDPWRVESFFRYK